MANDPITGLVFLGKHVSWTTRRKGREGAGKPTFDELAVEWGEGGDGLAVALKESGKTIEGAVSVAIPSTQLLMRVVKLPTTDPGELAGMARLQVDKFSPFPTENMLISYELLEKNENSSRVLVVGVQYDVVEKIGAQLAGAGIFPEHVDLDLLAWWRLLVDEKVIIEKGCQVVIIEDRGGCHVVITQDGVPVVLRLMGAPGDFASEEELATELVQELSYTLTSMELEYGSEGPAAITLLREEEGPALLLTSRLHEEYGVKPDVRNLDLMPPLAEGVVRRAAERKATMLDLKPEEWRESESSRLLKRRLVRGTVVFAGIWLLGLSVIFGAAIIESKRLSGMNDRLERTKGPAKAVRNAKTRLEKLRQYSDHKRSVLECWRETVVHLPREVEMTTLSYKKDDTLDLRGRSTTDEPIYKYKNKLDASELFYKVELVGGVSQNARDKKWHFRMKIDLSGVEE